MKIKNKLLYILILISLLLVGNASSFLDFNKTYADAMALSIQSDMEDTTKFMLVHNFTKASGVFEEDVVYYDAEYHPYSVIPSHSYSVGESIDDYATNVYKKIDTYSLYKLDETLNAELISDTIECFGKSNAIDTYIGTYALTTIMANTTTNNIELSVGLGFVDDAAYGTLETSDYVYFDSENNFSLKGDLLLTNTINSSSYGVYIKSGSFDIEMNIESSGKPALVLAGNGDISVRGDITSDADKTIHIPSSTYKTKAVDIYGSVTNTGSGYAVLNEAQREVRVLSGNITANNNAIRNTSTGAINVTDEYDGITIESKQSYAIYNSLSANITLQRKYYNIEVIANYNDVVYLNKGNLYSHEVSFENKSATGNIIDVVNNGVSSVIDIYGGSFTLPSGSTGYHIYNNSIDGTNFGQIYLSGDISYANGTFIYTKNHDTIYAKSTFDYSGDVVTIHYYGSSSGAIGDDDIGYVVVKDVSESNKDLFTLVNTTNYALKLDGTNLVIGYVYRVTYLPNGADSGVVPEDLTRYNENDIVTVKDTDITRVGYEFDGWTSDNVTYKPNDTLSITKNTTFLAKWKEKNYTITYKIDNSIVHTDTYTISTTKYNLYEDTTHSGYTIKWKASGNANGWDESLEYSGSITMNRWYGDVTLNAELDVITYKVTFKKDGSLIDAYTIDFTVETDTFSLNYTEDKVGHYFFGWVSEDSPTPNRVVTITNGTAKDITYTAYFEEKSYIYYLVNLEDNYYAYTYTLLGSVKDIKTSTSLDEVMASIDSDRYESDSYTLSKLYLGLDDNTLEVKENKSIILNDALDVVAYVKFTNNILSAVDSEYSQKIGNDYSYYNLVTKGEVSLKINLFESINNTNIYVDTGVTCNLNTLNILNGTYSEYNAIYNKGTLIFTGNVVVGRGNIYNLGTINVNSSVTINKTNYIYNAGHITFFDKGHIVQEENTFSFDSSLIDNFSINNNGIITLYSNTIIPNVIISRVCSENVYLDIPSNCTSQYKVVVMIDTYSISKIAKTSVDVARLSLVGVIENNSLKTDFVITSGIDGLYINREYIITYDFGGGAYNEDVNNFVVVDGESHILISQNNLSRNGYSFDGIYRYKNQKYIDVLGQEFTSLYNENLLIENSWQEIDVVSEDYSFIVRWQINTPTLSGNTIYASSTIYNGNNYIYAEVTNESLGQVTYEYSWYKSESYDGTYNLITTSSSNRLDLSGLEDSGYYYVVVKVSDGVSKESTTSNKKYINIRPANIEYVEQSYTGVYDGENHSATILNIVTVKNVPYTLTYSLNNVNFENTIYQYKDYTNGAITIYYKITAEYHNDVTGTLTVDIQKRNIIIKANDETSVYGDSIKAVSYTITSGSLVNNADLGTILAETDADAMTAQEYDIIIKYQANSNYDVTTIQGVYEVTKKDLVIKAKDVSVTYGDAIANYEYDIIGLVTGDNESVLMGNIAFTTIYTTHSQVGQYDVTPYGYESDNYNIIYEKGVITVARADIMYDVTSFVGTYDNKYHTAVVHDIVTINNLSYTIRYSINGGSTFTQNSAQLYKNVIGNMEVWFKISATNHNDVIDKGIVTINKREITITLDTITTKYLESEKPLTYSITSGTLADGETLKTLGISVSREQGIMPGSYKISATHTTTNYDITYVNA
ncbi:MAG: hypothetical protein IJW28_02710, partial [Clostridia bacterium]|nr:hypothetical protein [Clostridia bacterium]